jgi:hypothetical protein
MVGLYAYMPSSQFFYQTSLCVESTTKGVYMQERVSYFGILC